MQRNFLLGCASGEGVHINAIVHAMRSVAAGVRLKWPKPVVVRLALFSDKCTVYAMVHEFHYGCFVGVLLRREFDWVPSQ